MPYGYPGACVGMAAFPTFPNLSLGVGGIRVLMFLVGCSAVAGSLCFWFSIRSLTFGLVSQKCLPSLRRRQAAEKSGVLE